MSDEDMDTCSHDCNLDDGHRGVCVCRYCGVRANTYVAPNHAGITQAVR